MRKNNKKRSSSLLTKTGVILVTILFIVAMALIFVTTALMISIAGRQRIYTNTIDSQARLTAVSLAQTVWQAIVSQQINDTDLETLARGNGGNGTVVVFKTNELPGMGLGDSESTAYFYVAQEANGTDPLKIAIECKCEIDGVAQYYTLMLQKNQGEGTPPAEFDIGVNLGDGGLFNSCVLGFDVDYFNKSNANYDNQVSWRPSGGAADDNIVFLHNPTWNGNDNMGFYATLLTDGTLGFRDGVFARDTFLLGENAGINLSAMNQGIAATQRTNGSTGDLQYGNIFFYGTTAPFQNGEPWTEEIYWPTRETIVHDAGPYSGSLNAQYTFRGINNLVFDIRHVPAHTEADGTAVPEQWIGFSDFNVDITSQSMDHFATVSGGIVYETGVTGFTNSTGRAASVQANGWDSDAAAMYTNYITNYTDKMDTIDKVIDHYGSYEAGATNLDLTSVATVSAGNYLINTSMNIDNKTITFDMSGDSILVFVDGATITLSNNAYFEITGSNPDAKVLFFLKNGAKIVINDNSGIVDLRCFTDDYTNYDYADINQAKDNTPRCIIYSLYTANGAHDNYPVYFGQNQHRILTAFLAFYPQSEPNGTGGCHFGMNNITCNDIYYGRISAGGIDKTNGNFLYIPYCPGITGETNYRDTAYRDSTNFSVIGAESGYFTA